MGSPTVQTGHLDFSLCETKLNQGEIAPSLQTQQLIGPKQRNGVKTPSSGGGASGSQIPECFLQNPGSWRVFKITQNLCHFPWVSLTGQEAGGKISHPQYLLCSG